jgi:hypothetical protein
MKVSELTDSDDGRVLTEGLWLEQLADSIWMNGELVPSGTWVVNDENTAVVLSPDEDIDTIRDEWLAAVGG